MLAFDSGALSGVGDVLAGKSAADDINPRQRGTLANVRESLRVGEVFGEDAAAVGVDFDLPDRFDSRALESKIEASDARKKRTMRQSRISERT